MKVVAYTPLHYGLDYLSYAIRSVIDHVDKYYVFYSPIGSHGHRTDVQCPEKREDLLEAAYRAAGVKLEWYEGQWAYEGAQREEIFKLVSPDTLVIALDADEIWANGLLPCLIQSVQDNPARSIRVPIIHYWRSFYQCVLHDPAYPVRATLTSASGERTLDTQLRINHFGYAQRPKIVGYKQLTHGHKGEWRKDVDWFNDVFMANRQVDCHPVGSEYWNPETINPLDYMPEFMVKHPYYWTEVIE